MYSKFTDVQKADIVAQYWRGKPVTGICAEYGISKTTVYGWVRPFAVKAEAAADGRDFFIHDQGHLLLHLRYCRFVFTQGGGIQDIPLLFCQTGHGDIQKCVCGKRQSERPGFSQRSGNAIHLDRISQSPGVMRRRSVLFLSRKACGQCGGGIVFCQPEAGGAISE